MITKFHDTAARSLQATRNRLKERRKASRRPVDEALEALYITKVTSGQDSEDMPKLNLNNLTW